MSIPLPASPKLVNQEGNTAIFEVDGLYPGYGVTIGNGLRRVLLSSLEGAAITQVRIKGANHEFATLSGVLEDVIMILLNIKKLNFKCFSEEPQTISLKVKGERAVKAKDFKLTSEVELMNPEQHLATLTKSTTEFEIEAKVEKGIGYEPVEKRENEKAEVGTFFVDAIYTPIKRVSMKVESTRVGKRTDFDKLILEIETNGVLTPTEAWNKASDILISHFNLIAEAFTKVEVKEKEKEVKKPKEDDSQKKIKTEDLNIPERARAALLKASIKTVGGLIKKTEKDLLDLEGMGEKAMGEVKKELKKMKLSLKTE
jgi:DNA-directed RNA polymerase subunit alpha